MIWNLCLSQPCQIHEFLDFMKVFDEHVLTFCFEHVELCEMCEILDVMISLDIHPHTCISLSPDLHVLLSDLCNEKNLPL